MSKKRSSETLLAKLRAGGNKHFKSVVAKCFQNASLAIQDSTGLAPDVAEMVLESIGLVKEAWRPIRFICIEPMRDIAPPARHFHVDKWSHLDPKEHYELTLWLKRDCEQRDCDCIPSGFAVTAGESMGYMNGRGLWTIERPRNAKPGTLFLYAEGDKRVYGVSMRLDDEGDVLCRKLTFLIQVEGARLGLIDRGLYETLLSLERAMKLRRDKSATWCALAKEAEEDLRRKSLRPGPLVIELD